SVSKKLPRRIVQAACGRLTARQSVLTMTRTDQIETVEIFTWKESSDFFIAAGGPNSDPHGLDVDHNGVPCQSLR
ncbi:MAG: hypothetical protein OTJ43_09140, partial [Dehalococcoidia bacterium]|nr:hypothetical protein [Dehalococcoidia bacterium]